jgi:hypothetical protein
LNPLNRARVGALFPPTAIAGTFVIWSKVHFGVPFSTAHLWVFGFLWLLLFIPFGIGSIAHESLRARGRK